jgi:Zn-finger nucleic acid-binding protein
MAMTCPRCDTALQGNEKVCPQCKKPLTASTLASVAAKEIPCPICKLKLYSAHIVEAELLHCAECQGSALTREAMMKLQPYGAKEIQIGADERDYKRPPFFEPRKKPPFLICPFCSKRMKENKLGPMQVDLCESCHAVWLEASKGERLNDLIGPYKWRMSKAR